MNTVRELGSGHREPVIPHCLQVQHISERLPKPTMQSCNGSNNLLIHHTSSLSGTRLMVPASTPMTRACAAPDSGSRPAAAASGSSSAASR